ncbi:MAG: hypothetical protein E7655_01425 [Ruminococcaceae bacterium]|nr:hypothetical protein [Oscillospiraceae bacterium]
MIYSLLAIPGSDVRTIGQESAELLGFDFFDTDLLLEEKHGKSVCDLFTEQGETAFRRLEREVLLSVLDKQGDRNTILVCGDGLVTAPYSLKQLQTHTHPIWIKKSVKNIVDNGMAYLLPPYNGDRHKFIDACWMRYLYSKRAALYVIDDFDNDLCVGKVVEYIKQRD